MRGVVKIINPYDPGEFPRSGEVLQLGSNENPYPPSERVRKAYCEAAAKINRYPDARYQELKEVIAEYVECDAKNVALGCGASELINRVCDCIVEELDKVVIPMPSYTLYAIYAMLRSASIEMPVFKSYRIDAEAIAELKPKLTFVCSPNNPTGNVVDRKTIKRLAEVSQYLVIDEAYAEFASKSCVDLALQLENVIVLRSFSKFFGLAGLRVGYAIANEEIADAIERVRLPFAISQPALSCAIAAIEDVEYYEDVKRKIIEERERVSRELSKRFFVYPSEANFILVKVEEGFSRRMLERGIIVRRISLPGLEGEHARITIGTKEENDALLAKIQ
ncbi:MAG: histidinol-phosphate transaminase [Archaeoglobaceae archaeon]